jgi:hypothetical protein
MNYVNKNKQDQGNSGIRTVFPAGGYFGSDTLLSHAGVLIVVCPVSSKAEEILNHGRNCLV